MNKPKICEVVERYGYETIPIMIEQIIFNHFPELASSESFKLLPRLLEVALKEIADGKACGCLDTPEHNPKQSFPPV